MRCGVCLHGVTEARLITLALDRDATAVVFRGVPAQVRQECGEQHVADSVTALALQRLELALARSSELEVVRWDTEKIAS